MFRTEGLKLWLLIEAADQLFIRYGIFIDVKMDIGDLDAQEWLDRKYLYADAVYFEIGNTRCETLEEVERVLELRAFQ